LVDSGPLAVPGEATAGLLAVGVVEPGVVALVLLAPVVAPGVVALGALVAGAAVVVVGVPASAVVTVLRMTVAEPELPASDTSDAASTPSDRVITTATAMIGPFQLEEVARRVRAAAPQCRHHS
jgi:hypothetical protein